MKRWASHTGLVAALILAVIAPASARLRISSGETIHARLTSSDINTKNAQVGQSFEMRMVPPYPGGHPSLAGATLYVTSAKRVAEAKAAKRN